MYGTGIPGCQKEQKNWASNILASLWKKRDLGGSKHTIHSHSINEKTNSLHAELSTQSEMKCLSIKINGYHTFLHKACFPIPILILPYRNKVYFYNLLNLDF